MATTAIEVCNNALTLIGSRRITSLSDPSKEARACNDNYNICRKAVLRMHPWNFATKRVELTGVDITAIADNGAGLIEVTAVAHGRSTGNYVTIEGVVGTVEANVDNALITVVDADTFTIDDSVFANAYVSGGTVALAPAFEYRYKFPLPSDHLRQHTVKDAQDERLNNTEWQVEEAYLLTDYSTIRYRYVYDAQTTTAFDALFDEALAAYLAEKICYKITGSEALKQNLQQSLKKSLEKARFVDSVESSTEMIDMDDWTRARVYSGDGFIRNPGTN